MLFRVEDDRFETDVLIETNRHCLGKLEVLYREVCERGEKNEGEKSEKNEGEKSEVIEGEKSEKNEGERGEKNEGEKSEMIEEENSKEEKTEKMEEEKTETHETNEQNAPIKLADTALSAVDKRAIRRLYGKGVDEVVMMMLTLAPKTTIPVPMKRMREKEEQWTKEKCMLEAVGQAAVREA